MPACCSSEAPPPPTPLAMMFSAVWYPADVASSLVKSFAALLLSLLLLPPPPHQDMVECEYCVVVEKERCGKQESLVDCLSLEVCCCVVGGRSIDSPSCRRTKSSHLRTVCKRARHSTSTLATKSHRRVSLPSTSSQTQPRSSPFIPIFACRYRIRFCRS